MKTAIVAGVAATVMAVGAFAGEGMKSASSFESLDKNADGRISASEASADQGLASSFATADANADGGLTKAEFQSWHDNAKKMQHGTQTKPYKTEPAAPDATQPTP